MCYQPHEEKRLSYQSKPEERPVNYEPEGSWENWLNNQNEERKPCIKRKEGYIPDDWERGRLPQLWWMVMYGTVKKKKNSISYSRSTNQVIRSFSCTTYLWNWPFHRAGCCSGNASMVSYLISWLSRPTCTQLIYFSPLHNFHTHSGPTGHPIEGYRGREGDFSLRLVPSV